MVKLAMKQMKQRKKDEASPVLNVEATLVEKHKVRRTSAMSSAPRTKYYATFAFGNDERQEFSIFSWPEYLSFVEGDVGQLTFQGSIYIKFESLREASSPKPKGIDKLIEFAFKAIDDIL